MRTLLFLAALIAGAALLRAPATRGLHALCEAAAAHATDHRNPCTGEVLNRFYVRTTAGAGGLEGAPLALEFRHVFSSSPEAFYESVRAEWGTFKPGRYELGRAGAPTVRYSAGILGQPKLRCDGVVKEGAIQVRVNGALVVADFDLRPGCVITKGVGTDTFRDSGPYAELAPGALTGR